MVDLARKAFSIVFVGAILSLLYYLEFGLNLPHFDSPNQFSKGSVEERIWLCSPFVSLDAKRELDFLAPNKVTLSNTSVDKSKSVQRLEGDWNLINSIVYVKIAGESLSYKFVDIDDDRFCLLTIGEKNDQNIADMWYGGIGNTIDN